MEHDVAIIGGGLAGSLLARQIRRAAPTADIALFEKSTERSYKVGESTGEIAADYLIRKHELSHYLYEHHLPKNGLRYFFDNQERSLPLEAMSEIGSNSLPFLPAFQIDRARMETDLLEMNRQDGVQVHTGVQATRIELGSGGQPHQFRTRTDASETSHRCRWLIDATGRAALLAKARGLQLREDTHRIGASWGRFEGVADVDALRLPAFRSRVRHTSRRLSTLHFWYPGYWFWVIPLRGGLTSIGVTGEVVTQRRELRSPEGFIEFIKEHRALRELMARATKVDFGSFNQIAYGTRRFFHPDRWGLTGESATAADPFYSPGADFIALENDFLTDLVKRDLDGRPATEIARRCDAYDAFVAFRHEATMHLFRGLYGALGSFDLARAKWNFDIGSYYNLWLSSYMRDRHLDLRWLNYQAGQRDAVLAALRNFADLFRKTAATLRKSGPYHERNAGQFYFGLTHLDFVEKVGRPCRASAERERTARIFNIARQQALAAQAGDSEATEREPLPLSAFFGTTPLG